MAVVEVYKRVVQALAAQISFIEMAVGPSAYRTLEDRISEQGQRNVVASLQGSLFDRNEVKHGD